VLGVSIVYNSKHAERVLRILNLEDQIDGLIFCDYQQPNFACKPDAQYYHEGETALLLSCNPTNFIKALVKAQVTDPTKCYFVDDNRINVDAARALGWGHVVHFCEAGPFLTSALAESYPIGF
jgi:pyrimidine and pyridine-specific 5'-nucleotidase